MKFSLKDRKTLIILAATLLILITIPIAIILVLQRQEVRKKAEGTNDKIICVVNGDRYNSDSIRVINNTSSQTNHQVKRRFCRLDPPAPTPKPQLPLQFGYECNGYDDPGAGDQNQTVNANSDRTFTINIPNCMIGQLDITGCECSDLNCTQTKWEGGLAYTMQANITNYNEETGTCPQITPTITPTVPITPPTGTPTRTPTPPVTGTRTPTPTSTPTGTLTPTPTNPPGSTPTPTTPPPVSGNLAPTVFTIVGGGLLLLIGLLL